MNVVVYIALPFYLQVLMDLGSVEPARLTISTHSQAQYLQDLAAERCSMPYRPPELFQVDSKFTIDERTDIWVCMYQLFANSSFGLLSLNLATCGPNPIRTCYN